MSKPITKAQLDTLERVVDKVFANIGIDIEFTRHFLDRVNDERNRKQITIRELGELFAKEYKRWGREIAKMPIDTQAVMKDLSSELNIPFVLNPDGKEKDLVAKTVMRKKNFRTPNKELPVENVNEATIGSTAQEIAAALNQAAGFENEVFQVFGSSGKGTGPRGFGGRDTGNTIKWMTHGAKNRAEEQGMDIDEVAREAKAAVKQWFAANGWKSHKFRDIDTNTTDTYYIKGPIAVKDAGYYLRVNSKRMLQNKNRFRAEESVNEMWPAIVPHKRSDEWKDHPQYDKIVAARKEMKSPYRRGDVHDVMTKVGLPPDFPKKSVLDYIEEKHGAKRGKQVKGRSATPKKSKPSKSGQQPHPMRGKLVGEEQINEVGGGKVVATVNGYPIHDMGAAYPHKDKRFLIRDPNIDVWQASAPTLKAAGAKAKELKPSVKQEPKTQAQIDHDDWRDEQRAKIATGEIRRAVRSRRGLGEKQISEERSETCCEGKLGEYDVYVEYYPRNDMYMVHIPEANMPAFRREYGRIDLTQEFATPEDAMEHVERETYNEVEWIFTKSSLDEADDESFVRTFVNDKRREGWSVYASRINHGVEGAHRLEFEKDGQEFEIIGKGNRWELFRDGPTMSGRGEEFDGLDAAFQTATYEQDISEFAVRAAWESYQMDERFIRDPREAMLDMALKFLDRKVRSDKTRQSLGGHAYEVAREVNLNQIGVNYKELANLYRDWKGDSVVTEGWIEENLYYLDEVINTNDQPKKKKRRK